MIYTIYEVDREAGAVSSREAVLAEMECGSCAASWAGLPEAVGRCPYCDCEGLFEGHAGYGWIDPDDGGLRWYTVDGGASWTTMAEQSQAAASYARDIRGVVRALWAGAIDYDQAGGLLLNTIRLGIERAFHEGARSVGILPSELTWAERSAITDLIASEAHYVPGLLGAVHGGRKGGPAPLPLGPLLARADMWGLRYADVAARARAMVGADAKLRWTWDPDKEHCVDCAAREGKVKRASYWQRDGALPKSHLLACGGWRCGCDLVPTDERCTPGPLPKLVGRG